MAAFADPAAPDTDVTYRVTVRPALRALLRADRPAGAAEAGAPAELPPTPPAEPIAAPAAPDTSPPSPRTLNPRARPWRLARSGRRPLVFHGDVSYQRTTRREPAQSDWFELTVFHSAEGDAVVHVAQLSGADRGEYRHADAAVVGDAEALAAFLDSYDPTAAHAPPRALLETDADADAVARAAQDYADACAQARVQFDTLLPTRGALGAVAAHDAQR